MRYFFTLLLFLPCFLYAQEDGYIRDVKKKWSNAAAYTLEVARLMPEADLDFKPTPEEMSFKEQLLHMMSNAAWLSSSYLGGDRPPFDFKKTDCDKEQLLHIIAEGFRLSASAIEQLPASALEEEVKFFAGPMNKRQILTLMNDHMTHHRGQLMVYLRLKGIKPPEYRGW